MTKPFSYYDGSEEKLYEIFNTNEFNEHNAWWPYTKEWALYYHLSPLRKNLLSWIKFHKKEVKILELGAGCGAITSGLCMLDGIGKHVAVEGSPTRAELVKIRCKNYKHVEVINSNFEDFNTDEKFDYVFIIGVLEYSGKYINDENPYQKFIDHASSFLMDDGILVLAIENQLGHKYLAGFNEDHYAKPYVGLSNYNENVGIRTFDKETINKMLEKANLKYREYFYPFPDYKLQKYKLSEDAFSIEGFRPLDILDFPTSDLSHKNHKPNFNEKRFLETLQNSVDVSVFMNSFLLFASKSKIESHSDFLVAKFNTERTKKYQSIKKFKRSDNNSIVVETDNDSSNVTDYYKNHSNLFDLLVNSYEFDKEQFVEYFNIWTTELNKSVITQKGCIEFETFSSETLRQRIYSEETKWIPSHFLDLIPNNILISKDSAEVKVIDQEWKIDSDLIPLNLVLDRGIFYILNKINSFNELQIINFGKWNLPDDININSKTYEDFRLFEFWFQKKVYNGNEKLSKKDIHDYSLSNVEVKLTFKRRLALKFSSLLSRVSIIKKMASYIASE